MWCTEGGLAGFSAEQVEEVRCVVRMLPIFFTTILYWTIYAQVPLLPNPTASLLSQAHEINRAVHVSGE